MTASLWHSSTLWAQVAAEEELGACSPTVLQGNILAILLDGIRVWRNDQYSILHKTRDKSSINSFKNRVCTSTYSVHISMTEYVLAGTEYIHHINASSNLGIEGMESPLRQIEWITSGTHSTPEQLRLPFHTPKCSQSTVHHMCIKNMVELSRSPSRSRFCPLIRLIRKTQLILQVLPYPLSQLRGQPP